MSFTLPGVSLWYAESVNTGTRLLTFALDIALGVVTVVGPVVNTGSEHRIVLRKSYCVRKDKLGEYVIRARPAAPREILTECPPLLAGEPKSSEVGSELITADAYERRARRRNPKGQCFDEVTATN